MLRCKVCGKPHYEANPRETARIKMGHPCSECEAMMAGMRGNREQQIKEIKTYFETGEPKKAETKKKAKGKKK